MDSLDQFVTVRSTDCLDHFPNNNSSNFRNLLYKSISLCPAQAFECGLAEITLQAPSSLPKPPAPRPPTPIPISKFFTTPSDGDIYMTRPMGV